MSKMRMKVYDEYDKKVFDFKEEPREMKKKMKLVLEKFR